MNPFLEEVYRLITREQAIVCCNALVNSVNAGGCWATADTEYSNPEKKILSSNEWGDNVVKVAEAEIILDLVRVIYENTKRMNSRQVILYNNNIKLIRELSS